MKIKKLLMKTNQILALMLMGCMCLAGCDWQKSPPEQPPIPNSLSEASDLDALGGISQYSVVEQADAQGVAAVRYFDDDNVCVSAYNKDRGNKIGFWELSLSKLNLRTSKMSGFYKGVQSTDYIRNICTYRLEDGNEAAFNGASIFYLANGELSDSIELDEAFRREANFNADKKALVFINQETRDLYCWTADTDKMRIIYQVIDAETKDKRYPYYPLFNSSGDRVLFQTSIQGMAEADRLACYSLDTGKLAFDIAVGRKSDVIEYAWFKDNSFFTWEPSDDNGGCTYITVYNADGHVTEKYAIDKTIVQVQAGQSRSAACVAVLVYDGYDEENKTVQNSIVTIDFLNATAKQVYKSERSIVSLDLSPSTKKAIWSENEKIFELSLKDAQAMPIKMSKIE